MNINHYHINLRNEDEFKFYCSNRSIEVFNEALNQTYYPSRCTLLITLVKETIYIPFYLIYKIGDTASHALNLLCLKENQRQHPFRFSQLRDFLALTIFQFSTPFICAAIRICATVSGLLVPPWALRGWILAEEGEKLFHRLWAQYAQHTMIANEDREGREEIVPSNAIFYLGWERTFRLARRQNEQNQHQLDENIIQEFSKLVIDIHTANPIFFQQLLVHRYASGPIQNSNKHYPHYFLSHDVKQILFNLEQNFLQDQDIDLNVELIQQGISLLSREQKERLFFHVYINLQHALLDKKLNFDRDNLEPQMILLKDLFSLALRFGRAHFPLTSHSFYIYTRV